MRSALGGGPDPRAGVRRLLVAAQRARTKLELLVQSPINDQGVTLAATIEQIGDREFIISRPVVGGAPHQLAPHDRLRMSFITTTKRYSADTCCLGRAKIPSGGKRLLYGYRLLLPETLQAEERRSYLRTTVGYDLAPTAELISFGFNAAVKGMIIDLNAGGVQIRGDLIGRFALGQQVYVKAELPEPAGVIREMGEVAWMRRGKIEGQMILGIRFLEPVPSLGKFVRITENRRARRRRAG